MGGVPHWMRTYFWVVVNFFIWAPRREREREREREESIKVLEA